MKKDIYLEGETYINKKDEDFNKDLRDQEIKVKLQN